MSQPMLAHFTSHREATRYLRLVRQSRLTVALGDVQRTPEGAYAIRFQRIPIPRSLWQFLRGGIR